MKDLPHHIKKLNRKVIRSIHREEKEEEALPDLPAWPDSERQKKKKAKLKMKNEKLSRAPTPPTPEERNKVMKRGRVPVFDRKIEDKPHKTPVKKKTPRI
jgi:hypothetical protein